MECVRDQSVLSIRKRRYDEIPISARNTPVDWPWITLVCDLCATSTFPIPAMICGISETAHIFCDNCSNNLDRRCPCILEDVEEDGDDAKPGQPCDNILIGANVVGLPMFLDSIMKNVPFFLCSAFALGCTFVGTGCDVINHKNQDCEYWEITTCQEKNEGGKACQEYFANPSDLVEHLLVDHKRVFAYPEKFQVEVPFTNGHAEGINTPDGGKLTRRAILDYSLKGEQRLCLLMVDENYTHVRISLTELRQGFDSEEREEINYALTVQVSSENMVKYVFKSQVQPFGYSNFGDDENEYEMFFEIRKKVLRKCSTEREKGLWCFEVTVDFREESVETKNGDHQSIAVLEEDEDSIPGSEVIEEENAGEFISEVMSEIHAKIDAEVGSSGGVRWRITLPLADQVRERPQGQNTSVDLKDALTFNRRRDNDWDEKEMDPEKDKHGGSASLSFQFRAKKMREFSEHTHTEKDNLDIEEIRGRQRERFN